MKKILSIVLSALLFINYTGIGMVMAAPAMPQQNVLKPAPNARKIDIAFVFDGPSDKNAEVMETFKKTITRSLLPDYIAVYPNDLIFTGNWSENSAKDVSEKAHPLPR